MSEHVDPFLTPAEKEEFNKGFEGDSEGGAMVVIGSKEEAEKARARFEQEGKAANLDTLFRLNKRKVVPKENTFLRELHELNPKNLVPGSFALELFYPHNGFLLYIDSEGDLAEVYIDFKKNPNLEDLPELSASTSMSMQVQNRMVFAKFLEKNFGFSFLINLKIASATAPLANDEIYTHLIKLRDQHQKEEEKRAQAVRKKAFDY